MTGDIYKKVQPGDKFQLPAKVFNAWIDMAKAAGWADQGSLGIRENMFRQCNLVRVKNDTPWNLPSFSVLGLEDPIMPPVESGTVNPVTFHGVTPIVERHSGRFAITIEPIGRGEIGWAAVGGLVPVKLSVSTWLPCKFAEVDNFYKTQALRCSQHGSARVLWRSEPDYYSMAWGIVRLGEYERSAFVRPGGYSYVVRYNLDTGQWENVHLCQIVNVSGGEFQTGKIYLGRFLGRLPDLYMPIYGVACCPTSQQTTTTTPPPQQCEPERWFTQTANGASVIVLGPNRVRIVFQDAQNCGGSNNQIQTAYACKVIETATARTLGMWALGRTENSRLGYDRLIVKLNGQVAMIGESKNWGLHQCDTWEGPISPVYVELPPGSHLVELEASTVDGLNHASCYWEFSFWLT